MPERPIRILHVVGGMNRGGVETWLMHVLRHIDRTQYQMDFLVHTEQPCAYDDEIRALGSRIIPCMHPSRPLEYGRKLKQILREHGPYDVVHSHVHHFSGYVLWLAKQAGVEKRIAHSHYSGQPSNVSFLRQLYLTGMRFSVRQFATQKLAISERSAQSLYGQSWHIDKLVKIVYYGIDIDLFARIHESVNFRREFGIPEDTIVVGHVGSFRPEKNHKFFINVARQLVHEVNNICFLLVGDGDMRPEIVATINNARLTNHFILTGVRDDIPAIMLNAMDVFLFPSTSEGFGLVILEAQAAGLPCVVSDVVPPETDVIPELITRLSLNECDEVWSEHTRERATASRSLRRNESLEILKRSPFTIKNSTKAMEQVYHGANSE